MYIGRGTLLHCVHNKAGGGVSVEFLLIIYASSYANPCKLEESFTGARVQSHPLNATLQETAWGEPR